MARLRTWATLTGEDVVLDGDIVSIRDSVVTGMSYFVPHAFANDVWQFEDFDVVPGGVLLIARPEPIFIVWHMDDLYGEGIALIHGEEYADWITDLNLVEAAVDDCPRRIRGLLNMPLSLIAVSWQEAPLKAAESSDWRTVWACTLGAAGTTITFALGATDDAGDNLTYQPDSVAVIFDADRARRYRPPAATSSAFGQTIWQRRPNVRGT